MTDTVQKTHNGLADAVKTAHTRGELSETAKKSARGETPVTVKKGETKGHYRPPVKPDGSVDGPTFF